MGRSGYEDGWDGDGSNYIFLFRSIVRRSIEGKRGQAFLCELRDALEAMPEKRLIANDLQTADGAVCTIGAIGRARGVDMSKLTPDYPDQVAKAFGIAETLAREIAFANDDDFNYNSTETPEQRYVRMLDWVRARITPQPPQPGDHHDR